MANPVLRYTDPARIVPAAARTKAALKALEEEGFTRAEAEGLHALLSAGWGTPSYGRAVVQLASRAGLRRYTIDRYRRNVKAHNEA